MKVLFLCAGYGTRLQRDLQKDPTRRHLLGLPKALLPVHGETILDRWLRCLLPHIPLQDIFLVCNDYFYGQLSEWAFRVAKLDPNNVFNDKTCDNASRLGANRDIYEASKYFGWTSEDKVLVIAGDTLFLNDFDMKKFLELSFSLEKKFDVIVTHYRLQEDKETRLTGILELDSGNRVVGFLEKPEPEATKSRLACPCFYVMTGSALELLGKFLDEHKGRALETFDATGKFIRWLVVSSNVQVYSHEISGRLDIGALESLIQAETYFAANKSF